jgi:hypothetical protein
MTDEEIIDEAYAQVVETTWNVLYGVAVDKRPANEVKQAEKRFVDGVALARKVRDRAVELLKAPEPAPLL